MKIGARFAKWGLGLFIFGVFLTFGIIGHYCSGARWPNGELRRALNAIQAQAQPITREWRTS